ncbi:glycosyl transferase [Kordiimonas sediminis]|uniref:Glycosyl transferase n=1 Tax=Kordiimonas sediminis TaxID=1735581 RepID=A0A919E306_9PROT|nr:glycosyltransferase family 2 protein [Kordiimonas sediminis]GHF14300.1 glycosyl transferase [Kordiimonas sediminis]
MKLIIQIPCLNEEHQIAATLADLPTEIDGIDSIEILIIDDGSTDATADVARKHGAHHIVRHNRNRGLAAAFSTGKEACLKLGADIIVNTDADNQYVGADISKLVAPILRGDADIVVGDRQTATISHFSPLKRFLQKFGSNTVMKFSGVDVEDAVSGFRAFSRHAAKNLHIVSTYSYTIETLIQAGQKRMAIESVPVGTNLVERPSRLFTSKRSFITNQVATIFRIYAMYRPLRFFGWIGLILFSIGALPILRFLYQFFIMGDGTGHIQSLILGGVFVILGVIAGLIGLVADLIARNRRLIEILLEKE